MKDLNNTIENINPIENEIDLKNILNLIIRNKSLIIKVTVISFLLSCLYALSKKRVWEGQFQIVLNSNESDINIGSDLSLSNVASLAGFDISQNKTNLQTEVGILESPSVLMPIYELVKNQDGKLKSKTNFKSFENWSKSSLKMKLKKKTSILDIQYKDTNKNLIIPVLNKMANVYQNYSGKNKRRGIILTKEFLKNQIDEYKIKSFNSIKKAQAYGIDQDLTFLDTNINSGKGLPSSLQSLKLPNQYGFNSNQFSSSGIGDNVSIEVARVKAANQIRELNAQIKKFNSLSEDDDSLEYISFMVPNFLDQGLRKDLRKIDLKILEMDSIFTENYEPLKRFREKRKDLVKLLKKRAIGYLKAQKMAAEATMESAKRPKDVLLKYKEFVREAKRDENTLIQLENSLRGVQLEEAKVEDPWELITQPTLKAQPVAPNRKKIGLLGLFAGFIIGTLVAYLKERKTDLIFEAENLEKRLNSKIIEKINLSTYETLTDKSKFAFFDLISSNQAMDIISSKLIDKKIIEQIQNLIGNQTTKISYINNIKDLDNDKIIFLTSLGSITNKELEEIKKRLDINNKILLGILLVDL